MAGVSGAFLLLPWQISILGYVTPGVSATNQIFNILACPAGVWRYAREGRLLLPLALFIAIGTLPGVFMGAIIRLTVLSGARQFMFFVSLVLLYLGVRILFQKRKNGPKKNDSTKCETSYISRKGFGFVYDGETYQVRSVPIVILSVVVGLLGGIYGIGGGAVMSPFLISYFGLPLRAIAGATLFATFLTSIAGVGFYSFLASFWHYPWASPDWLLGALLGAGGILGMYCGAALQKYMPDSILRFVLLVIIFSMGIYYFFKSMAS